MSKHALSVPQPTTESNEFHVYVKHPSGLVRVGDYRSTDDTPRLVQTPARHHVVLNPSSIESDKFGVLKRCLSGFDGVKFRSDELICISRIHAGLMAASASLDCDALKREAASMMEQFGIVFMSGGDPFFAPKNTYVSAMLAKHTHDSLLVHISHMQDALATLCRAASAGSSSEGVVEGTGLNHDYHSVFSPFQVRHAHDGAPYSTSERAWEAARALEAAVHGRLDRSLFYEKKRAVFGQKEQEGLTPLGQHLVNFTCPTIDQAQVRKPPRFIARQTRVNKINAQIERNRSRQRDTHDGRCAGQNGTPYGLCFIIEPAPESALDNPLQFAPQTSEIIVGRGRLIMRGKKAFALVGLAVLILLVLFIVRSSLNGNNGEHTNTDDVAIIGEVTEAVSFITKSQGILTVLAAPEELFKQSLIYLMQHIPHLSTLSGAELTTLSGFLFGAFELMLREECDESSLYPMIMHMITPHFGLIPGSLLHGHYNLMALVLGGRRSPLTTMTSRPYTGMLRLRRCDYEENDARTLGLGLHDGIRRILANHDPPHMDWAHALRLIDPTRTPLDNAPLLVAAWRSVERDGQGAEFLRALRDRRLTITPAMQDAANAHRQQIYQEIVNRDPTALNDRFEAEPVAEAAPELMPAVAPPFVEPAREVIPQVEGTPIGREPNRAAEEYAARRLAAHGGTIPVPPRNPAPKRPLILNRNAANRAEPTAGNRAAGRDNVDPPRAAPRPPPPPQGGDRPRPGPPRAPMRRPDNDNPQAGPRHPPQPLHGGGPQQPPPPPRGPVDGIPLDAPVHVMRGNDVFDAAGPTHHTVYIHTTDGNIEKHGVGADYQPTLRVALEAHSRRLEVMKLDIAYYGLMARFRRWLNNYIPERRRHDLRLDFVLPALVSLPVTIGLGRLAEWAAGLLGGASRIRSGLNLLFRRHTMLLRLCTFLLVMRLFLSVTRRYDIRVVSAVRVCDAFAIVYNDVAQRSDLMDVRSTAHAQNRDITVPTARSRFGIFETFRFKWFRGGDHFWDHRAVERYTVVVQTINDAIRASRMNTTTVDVAKVLLTLNRVVEHYQSPEMPIAPCSLQRIAEAIVQCTSSGALPLVVTNNIYPTLASDVMRSRLRNLSRDVHITFTGRGTPFDPNRPVAFIGHIRPQDANTSDLIVPTFPSPHEPVSIASSISHRTGCDMPVPDTELHGRFMTFAKLVIESTPKATDADVPGILSYCAAAGLNKCETDEICSLLLESNYDERAVRVKLGENNSFVKFEGWDEIKYLRMINAHTKLFKALWGPYQQAVDHMLLRVHPLGFVKGLTLPEVGQLARDTFPGTVNSSDFTSMEAHHSEGRQYLMWWAIKHILSNVDVPHRLLRLVRCSILGTNVCHANGVKAVMKSRLMSGCLWTSSANGLLNMCLLAFLRIETDQPGFDLGDSVALFRRVILLVEGDDGLLGGARIRRTIIDALGLLLKIDEHSSLTAAAFLSQYTASDGTNTPDPRKVIRKMFCVKPSQSGRKIYKPLLRAKALSYCHLYGAAPITQAMVQYVLRETRSYDTSRVNKRDLPYLARDVDLRKVKWQPRPVSNAARVSVCELFHITVEEQLYIENAFDTAVGTCLLDLSWAWGPDDLRHQDIRAQPRDPPPPQNRVAMPSPRPARKNKILFITPAERFIGEARTRLGV